LLRTIKINYIILVVIQICFYRSQYCSQNDKSWFLLNSKIYCFYFFSEFEHNFRIHFFQFEKVRCLAGDLGANIVKADTEVGGVGETVSSGVGVGKSGVSVSGGSGVEKSSCGRKGRGKHRRHRRCCQRRMGRGHWQR